MCCDVNAVCRHACNMVFCSLDRSVLLSPARVMYVYAVYLVGP